MVSGEGCVDLMIIMPEGTNEAVLASGIEARIEEIHTQIEGQAHDYIYRFGKAGARL